ncbi:MAG TPA: hypothetical protein PLD73_00340 [Candidatus Hydrogenedentes bacterium]|jgi:hypothetical protein|nr:hypothetical protein [Candidatus Hydrogenedentota bacterium]HPJ97958.1 hypothetical protein [Candidatus Hydrogenedentota bacterium]
MSALTYNRRNDVRLLTNLDGREVSHFRLREFENAAGLAMVHSTLLESLERVRRDLCEMAGETVWILVTSAVRTEEDLRRLAALYGWTDQGGAVSRNSRHLAKFGGIAADIVAVLERNRARVPQKTLGAVCRRYFDWVKDDYNDGHVHADNRHRAAPPT